MLILDSLEIKPAKLLVALESDNAPAPLRQGEEDRPKDFAKVWADINADDVTQDPKLEAEVEGVALPIAEGEETLSEAIPQTQAKEGVEGNPLAQSVRLPTLNAEPKPVTILPTPQQEGIVEEKRG